MNLFIKKMESLLKQIIEAQEKLIDIMDENLSPCFDNEDIMAINSLRLEIEQLKEELNNEKEGDDEILLG